MYKNAPSVFVSANHTSSGGGLDPTHNSITAWVEVSQRPLGDLSDCNLEALNDSCDLVNLVELVMAINQ